MTPGYYTATILQQHVFLELEPTIYLPKAHGIRPLGGEDIHGCGHLFGRQHTYNQDLLLPPFEAQTQSQVYLCTDRNHMCSPHGITTFDGF